MIHIACYKKKLKLYTRIAMKVVDEGGRRGFLTHLKGQGPEHIHRSGKKGVGGYYNENV